MSLLLEALKKAELAKQGAQAEPGGEPAAEKAGPTADELTLVQEPHEPVITRENLPDISQPLEIRSEDLPSTTRASAREAEPAPQRPPAADRREPAAAREAPNESAAEAPGEQTAQMRNAARQVFDVKEIDYNPRRPFYFTVAALIAAGVGYGVYVWWQMQPHYAVNKTAVKVSAAPRPRAPAAGVVAAARASAPPLEPAPAAPAPKVTPTPKAPPAPEATPSARVTRPQAVPAAPMVRPSREAAPVIRHSARQPAARAVPKRRGRVRRARARAPISVTPSAPQADPLLQEAYGAYQRGEWQNARAQYQRVLEHNPGNRDALLGLAALDVRAHSYDSAERRYLRLLALNPRDTYAFAGLTALQGDVDPVLSESRIKNLLATQPQATNLYFTLGNQYAAQQRWSEAQGAYSKAYKADPQNPDYAFNLAVSLDHLREPGRALAYYRKAIAAAKRRPAAFNLSQAEARTKELAR